MSKPIYKIVLTGGPCGGKSTALPLLTDHFRNKGFTVFSTPEIASLFHEHGVDIDNQDPEHVFQLEMMAFNVQMQMEEGLVFLARKTSKGPVIIFHDRGIADFAAYCPGPVWSNICDLQCYTPEAVKLRYDQVLHFQTTAIGSEKFFTNMNNPARNCSLELAVKLDALAIEAWKDHPNRVELDNKSGFYEKISLALDSIKTFVSKDIK